MDIFFKPIRDYLNKNTAKPPRLKTRGFWAHENPEAQQHVDIMNKIMEPLLKEAHEESLKRTENMMIYGTTHPEILYPKKDIP